MENTIAYFGLKDEDDYMYKKAVAVQQTEMMRERENARKRLEQQQRFTVIGLLDARVLTDAQIITICNVKAELVRSVKRDLAAAPTRIVRLRKTLSVKQIAEKLNLPTNWVEKQLI